VLGAAPAQSSAIEPLATVVERTMVAAVDAEGGNLERAARRLQVNVRTLQRRLRAGRG
jgi:DNA-binding NtrC family response regulator